MRKFFRSLWQHRADITVVLQIIYYLGMIAYKLMQ